MDDAAIQPAPRHPEVAIRDLARAAGPVIFTAAI
jgi:hypothetical protein